MTVLDESLERLRSLDAVRRLHDRDAALWSDDPDHRAVVANRLGWLDVATPPQTWPGQIAEFAATARADGLRRVVLAGMGGSSLAPELFGIVFGGHGAGLELRVLDSTHPDAVSALLDDTDLASTLVVVSSKSGSTEETHCFASHAASLVTPERMVAITDAGSALEAQAVAHGWRAIFTNPADIGGRYSALSLFGMMPAGLVGAPIAAIWASAARMLDRCRSPEPDNPAARLAAFMAGHAAAGRDKLTLLTPAELAPLGDWVEQLVAESTGKEGVGVIPVVGEAIGEPGVYRDDRAFVAVRMGGDALLGIDDLEAAGHPVLWLDMPAREDIGAELVRWEVATALAGVLLGVNPFDEPNVSESKANTKNVLGEVAAGQALPDEAAPLTEVESLLARLQPGDYLSIQAYLSPTDEHLEPLARLRTLVRDRLHVATTFGWGPRFLHSTGQLHKGGPHSVVALQIVDRPAGGPDIPDRPYDFATLLRAQAVGDLRSLRDHSRRVTPVTVDGAAALEELVAAVESATR